MIYALVYIVMISCSMTYDEVFVRYECGTLFLFLTFLKYI